MLSIDALSSQDLLTQLDCLEGGRCALESPWTLDLMWMFYWRDIVGVGVATFGALQSGLVLLHIGFGATSFHPYHHLFPNTPNSTKDMQDELIHCGLVGKKRRQWMMNHKNDE